MKKNHNRQPASHASAHHRETGSACPPEIGAGIKNKVESLWRTGIAAVNGQHVVRAALREAGIGDIHHLVAVGKAAAAMCQGADGFLSAQSRGLLITKYNHIHEPDRLPGNIQIIESAHPVPDQNSLFAGQQLLTFIESIPQTDSLVMLVSGGASALVELLPANTTLDELQRLTEKLIADGYGIDQINPLRCRLSRIKGGKLLQNFHGRRVLAYAISDVPNDDIRVIGSGIGSDQPMPEQALTIPPSIRPIFDQAGTIRQPPTTRGFEYQGRIIASNSMARNAVAEQAARQGYRVLVNQHLNQNQPAQAIDQIAKMMSDQLTRPDQPGICIWGGEPTIQLPAHPGCGGRNQHLALLLARVMRGMDKVAVIVAGTDGTDGPTPYAGAIVDGETWSPDAQAALDNADSGTFLKQRGALFQCGPTGTNVMDLVVALKT